EAAFWWSENQVLDHRRDDYGFSVGSGLGLSYRHRISQAPGGPRGVGEYQIGLGCGDGGQAGGIAYGFSGPGRSVFGRENFLALGSILRPTPWLSLGSTGRIASGEQQGVLDLGVRPLSDPRVLLFASYALENDRHWDDGDPSGGIALRPIVGLLVGGVREKLLDLKRAGKKSVVYIDRAGAAEYYLASAADRIVMDPLGTLLIPGVQASRTYMKDALEKAGIGFEEWRYFKYKSALE